MAERLARVEEWIEGHEQRCEDRMASIGLQIVDVKTGQSKTNDSLGALNKAAWGVVIALVTWMAVQIYDGLKPHSPAAPVTIVAPAQR